MIYLKIFFPLFMLIYLTGCTKLIKIPPPAGTISTSQVFSTNEQATSAMSGIYFNMVTQNRSIFNTGLSAFCGLSADELNLSTESNSTLFQFQQNNLVSNNSMIYGNFWTNAYSIIYESNSIIEGLTNSTIGVNDSVKNELIGEAKFTRAFTYFYLVNLFGDLPLVTTINYNKTTLLYRTAKDEIYKFIVSDLIDAQNRLANDYSVGFGQKIVPNKWAAVALLARTYLYIGNWSGADSLASAVINNSQCRLTSLDSVFLANSDESIWQLQPIVTLGPAYNTTPDGYLFIPKALNSNDYQPFAYINKNLLNTFEPLDQRRLSWIDSTTYFGTNYFFPYKYKLGPANAKQGNTSFEFYSVLRLAEQYLIRSEAKAREANVNVTSAIADLNAIRNRAHLPDYSGGNDQSSLLNAIYHERQVEFFSEWGHRWLDLKRWGTATTTLSINKGFTISNNALLYPIPISELITNPNLTPNPGY